MINYELLLLFTGYLISLLIGFNIKKSKKDLHNKKYHKYKNYLYFLILSISLPTMGFLIIAATEVNNLYFIGIVLLFYLIFFFTLANRRSRCWKQHNMIIYHFILIPIIYLCSEILQSKYPLYVIIILYIYNILEFQFAKFNLKQGLIWD